MEDKIRQTVFYRSPISWVFLSQHKANRFSLTMFIGEAVTRFNFCKLHVHGFWSRLPGECLQLNCMGSGQDLLQAVYKHTASLALTELGDSSQNEGDSKL